MEALKKPFLALALVLAFCMAMPFSALADDPYYGTWKEYQESGQPATTWNDVANAMDAVFEAAYDAYASGDADTAYNHINDGYYGYYETTGFERTTMGYISGSRKSEVELQFAAAKSVVKNGGSLDELRTELDTLKSMIHEDANILDGTSGDEGGTGAGIATFIACLGIIVREGIEAILVIGAIIAYLVKSGNRGSLRQVYIGAILGIVCSFIAAWALNALKLANAAPQEIIEGVTALIAVVVLFWVSNWMISKSESKAWSAYIEKQVASSVAGGSVFALAFTAWLAVFREGAEVVLFYQPLLADASNMGYVWAGFGVGCVIIAIIFVAMRFWSVRLPIKPFFMAMSILMAVMCIAFLGGGIKELIEGDVIPMTPIPWIPSNQVLEVLGIYPCVQTVVPQLILLVIMVITFVLQIRKNRKLAAAADEAQVAEAPADAAVAQAAEAAEAEAPAALEASAEAVSAEVEDK